MFKYTIKNLEIELCKKIIDENKLNKIIKSKDIKINTSIDDDKTTLLHKMISTNRLLSVEWLLKNHANPYIENDNCVPAFFNIVDSKLSKNLLDLLLKYNLDIDFRNSHGRSILQDIVLMGDTKLLKNILPLSKRPFAKDKYGKNILFDAIANGSKDIIDIIYKFSHNTKDFNIITNSGDSLLLNFKDIEDLKILEFLLKIGVSPATQNKEDKNIIFYLSLRLEHSQSEEEINKIAKLIEMSLSFKELIEQKDKEGNTLLNSFIKNLSKPLNKYKQKDVLSNLIKSFITNGVNLNEKNNDGMNPLLVSIEKNDLETANILLEKGVDINEHNNKGQTPLMFAALKASRKYKEIIELLISYNANPNLKDNNNMSIIEHLIYILIYLKEEERDNLPNSLELENSGELLKNRIDNNSFIQDLLEIIISSKNIDLSSLDSQGNPIIFTPIITGLYNISNFLLKAGANINEVNKNGDNLLFYYLDRAVENDLGSQEIIKRIKKIVSYGIDLNQKDENGDTVLHKSILIYPLNIIHILSSFQMDTNAIDKKGRNILHTSIWSNDIQKVQYITNLNNKLLNKPDYFGVLAINYAAFLGNKEIVCYLIANGSFINNTFDKKKYIIDFFKRFYKNIIKLENLSDIDENDKKNILMLIRNMREEFYIVD